MADGSHTIRKSSFGRTQLFLPEANVTLREVKCMGGIQRRDGASVSCADGEHCQRALAHCGVGEYLEWEVSTVGLQHEHWLPVPFGATPE